MNFTEVMNSGFLYIAVILGLGFVVVMCIVMAKQAWKKALELGLTSKELWGVVRSSALFSIIPSLPIVAGFLALQSVIGVPWAWFRLSVLGSVEYELVAADTTAASAGFESTAALAQTTDINVISAVMMAMSVGIIGSIFLVLFFSKSVHQGMMSASKKKSPFTAVMMGCFLLAMFAVFIPIRSFLHGSAPVVASLTFATAAGLTLLQRWLITKYNMKWLNNFAFAIALLLGMVSAIMWTAIVG